MICKCCDEIWTKALKSIIPNLGDLTDQEAMEKIKSIHKLTDIQAVEVLKIVRREQERTKA